MNNPTNPERIDLGCGLFWKPWKDVTKQGNPFMLGDIVSGEDDFKIIKDVTRNQAKLLAKYTMQPTPAPSEALREALTPSAETKAAYHGEFYFNQTCLDHDEEEVTIKTMVPWTTVKEIMAAILSRAEKRAALATPSPAAEGGWYPIETAPKDGTRILVWADTRRKPRRGHALIAYWGNHKYGGDAWLWHDGKEWLGPDVATHWMPLPAAPQTIAKGV